MVSIRQHYSFRCLPSDLCIAIDYRGLLERLSLATTRQIIRAVVYSKLEGLPVTPIRPLYTPNRSVNALPTQNTPTKASSSVVAPAVSESSSSVAEIPTPVSVSVDAAPVVSSSSKKEKAKVTPKSVRIELPAATSTPEPRKHTLPKSSLSISVTAEDVSASSGQEDVRIAPPATTESDAPSGRKKDRQGKDWRDKKKLEKGKEKKRKRREEDESIVAAESIPGEEKATKKRKTDAVAAETTIDSDGMTAAQRKNLKRRQKTEELRKSAKAVQSDKDAIKLAATLVNRTGSVDTTGSDSANVSQSEDGQGSTVGRREKRRLKAIADAAEKLALERSLTEASDSMPSEDVHMDDSAAMEEDSVVPTVGASGAVEEPVVEVEVSTTTVTPETETVEEPVVVTPPAETIEEPTSVTPPAETIRQPTSVTPPEETIEEITPLADTVEVPETTSAPLTQAVEVPIAIAPPSTEADVPMTDTQPSEAIESSHPLEPVPSTAPEPKSNRKTKRKKEQKQKSDSPVDTTPTPVQPTQNEVSSSSTPEAVEQEAAPVVDAPSTAEQPKDTQEPKSNRRADRRKSLKKDQTDAVIVPSQATPEVVDMDATPSAPTVVAPIETTPAANTAKTKSKAAKPTKKPRQSVTAAALAEWRAKQSQGDAAKSSASQPAAASAESVLSAASQQNAASQEKASAEQSPEEESAVQTVPSITQEPIQSQKPDAVEASTQPSAASDSESTPPASSTQIPLPPTSQQIARLPSSSPESYSSSSEESQDAWQKAAKRVRSPGSEDLEPEGDDDDDEEGEGEDVGRRDASQMDEIDELDHSRRATPEAIASFTEPVSLPSPMAVDPAAEDEEIESRSATPQPPSSPMSEPPSSMSPVVYTIPVPSIEPTLEEPMADDPMTETDEPEAEAEVEDTRDGTPTLFAMTQDPLFTPTQAHSVPTPLTLTDLAAPTSPPMPSTGVVAFHDAMEEDAVADQAAMMDVGSSDNANGSSATRQTDEVSQSAGESATSRTISSQSQTSTGSPRRLRSRMRLRDGTQPETDPLKPLPLPTATPKKRGKQPKALSQAGTPAQKVCLVVSSKSLSLILFSARRFR